MAMLFLWHHALWLLIAVPMLAGTYVVLTRRQSHQRLRYVGLGLTGEPSTFRDVIKRHLPALLLFAGVTALLLALARPVHVTSAPAEQGTVDLLMDVSLSMGATDVGPNRLEAAKTATLAALSDLPTGGKVSLIAADRRARIAVN